MATNVFGEHIPDKAQIEAIAQEIKTIADQMYSEIAKQQNHINQGQQALSPIEHQAYSLSSAVNPSIIELQHLNTSPSRTPGNPLSPEAIAILSRFEPASYIQLQYSVSPNGLSPTKASPAPLKRETFRGNEDDHLNRSLIKFDDFTYSPSPLVGNTKGIDAILSQTPIKYEEYGYSSPFKEKSKSDNIAAIHKISEYDYPLTSSPFRDTSPSNNYHRSTSNIDYTAPTRAVYTTSENIPDTKPLSSAIEPLDSLKKDTNYKGAFISTQSSSGATGSTQAFSQFGKSDPIYSKTFTPQKSEKETFGEGYRTYYSSNTDSKVHYGLTSLPGSDLKAKTTNPWLDTPVLGVKATTYSSSSTLSPLKSIEKKPLYDKEKLNEIIQNINFKRAIAASATKLPTQTQSTLYEDKYKYTGSDNGKLYHQKDAYHGFSTESAKNAALTQPVQHYKSTDYNLANQRPHEGYSQIGRDFDQLKVDVQATNVSKDNFTPTPFKVEELNATATPLLDQDTYKYIWQEISHIQGKQAHITDMGKADQKFSTISPVERELNTKDYLKAYESSKNDSYISSYPQEKSHLVSQYADAGYPNTFQTDKDIPYATSYGGNHDFITKNAYIKEDEIKDTIKKNKDILYYNYEHNQTPQNIFEEDSHKSYRHTVATESKGERRSHIDEKQFTLNMNQLSDLKADHAEIRENPRSSHRRPTDERKSTRGSHKTTHEEKETGYKSNRSERNTHGKPPVAEVVIQKESHRSSQRKTTGGERRSRRSSRQSGGEAEAGRRSSRDERKRSIELAEEHVKESTKDQNRAGEVENQNRRKSRERRSSREKKQHRSLKQEKVINAESEKKKEGTRISKRKEEDERESSKNRIESNEIHLHQTEAPKSAILKVEKAYRVNELTGKLELAQGRTAEDKRREQARQEELLRIARHRCRVTNKTEKVIM